MTDAKDVKAALQRELEVLSKIRDDLRLQLKLAKSEALEEWRKLESTWFGVEAEFKRIGEEAREPVKDMASAARALMDELRRGYGRIKTQLKEVRQTQPGAGDAEEQRPEARLQSVQQSRGPSA
jgi:predicted  nucleic acid-binding Zn-ribbon protein